jgi:hypothetical protein
MPPDSVDGFADNWAYLKTELNWLERVLMTAIARQRKDTRDIDRVARNRADKATSHWWKGIIAAEGTVAYDDYRPPSPQPGKSYPQQLEARIQASRQQGVILALPLLRDRLELTPFEKNLLLLSLAPEVNRRYGRLYRYLHGEDTQEILDLPTVDLALRIFCRNDAEWREARLRLTNTSPLLCHHLLTFSRTTRGTLLQSYIQLTDTTLHYLLEEHDSPAALDTLLALSPAEGWLIADQTQIAWDDLVLPPATLTVLHHLVQRSTLRSQVDGFWPDQNASSPGTLAVFAGPTGTGKTTTARAIATALDTSLTWVDLATVPPADYPALVHHLQTQSPQVLLVKGAECWFRRSAPVDPVTMQQFLAHRRMVSGLTLFSLPASAYLALPWQRRMNHVVEFALPQRRDRQILWQQSFPATVPVADDVNWSQLAQIRLTGGQIRAIADSAMICFAAEQADTLTIHHIQQAMFQHRYSRKFSV